MTLLLICLSSSFAFASEKPSKVIISYIDKVPPFCFRDTDGYLQGVVPDYWRLWGKKMGIKVEFYISSWQGSLDAVANGDADIHSGMVPSDERKKIFDYADKETINTEEFLFVSRDMDVSSPEQLKNIPIWTDGGISASILKEKFKDIILINAGDYGIINEQIKNKAVSAFVMDENIAAYNLAKLDATGRFKRVYSVFKQPLVSGVKKGNIDLINLVNEGNALISNEEKLDISKKYIATRVESPVWLKKFIVFFIVGILAIFLLTYSILSRYQIKHKTKELVKALDEERRLRLENEKLLIQQNRLAQLGEMINYMTHQWKQPLNTINMLATELGEVSLYPDIDNDRIEKNATTIMEQVEFMSTTMDDFSGFTTSKSRVNDFHISDACKDALRLVEHSIKYRNIKVELDLNEDITVRGMKNDLVHVILNLVTNSIDAFISRGIADPKISIQAVAKSEKIAQITYADNAGGLKNITTEEIFEPYISTKANESGTGIGLYLSRNILKKSLNGDIKAENVGDGLIFYIEIKV